MISAVESSRERRDFDGRADCENGVVDEARPTETPADPLVVAENTLFRSSGGLSEESFDRSTFCEAEIVMYVSMHLAKYCKEDS